MKKPSVMREESVEVYPFGRTELRQRLQYWICLLVSRTFSGRAEAITEAIGRKR